MTNRKIPFQDSVTQMALMFFSQIASDVVSFDRIANGILTIKKTSHTNEFISNAPI